MHHAVHHATWGPAFWSWFLSISAAVGLTGEGIALLTNVYNTLTYYSRDLLKVVPHEAITMHTAAWVLSLGAWVTFTVWFTGHIWFNLWSM